MRNEEKLKHFYNAAVEAANAKSAKALDEYSKGLEEEFQAYKKDALRKQTLQLKLAKKSMKKEVNSELAENQVKIRRSLGEKQEEIKELLFHGVEKRLEEYKKTPAYMEYLTGHVEKAKVFARGEEILIYIDPADEEKKEKLEKKTGVTIQISEYGFGGGVRALIRSKNILIDQSFETRLKEARDEFSFPLD